MPNIPAAQEFLKTAAATIRSLRDENVELRAKVASYERQSKMDKLATVLTSKGVDPSAILTADCDLALIEKAAAMITPQTTFAQMSGATAGYDPVSHMQAVIAEEAAKNIDPFYMSE